MRFVFPIVTTSLTLAAVVGLAALRRIGLYSHQAFALALVFGLGWAIVSRLWLGWRGRLYTRFVLEWRHPENRSHRWQVVARGAFWGALGAAALLVFPRSAELTGLIAGLAVVASLRLAACLLPAREVNAGPSAVMALGAAVLFGDLGHAMMPTAAPVIRLEAPFAGDWLVVQGGHSAMQSHHLAAYNQVYALDLVKLEEGKMFAQGEGNAMVATWEEPLFAPIDGTVVMARDEIEDSVGLHLVTKPEDAAGNVVVIETASGHFVVLAHLRHHSVLVHKGDHVTAGQPIAKAGNSGNTTMSHLHIQVQTHADLWDRDNRSVPFAFGPEGRTLARNGRVLGRSIASE